MWLLVPEFLLLTWQRHALAKTVGLPPTPTANAAKLPPPTDYDEHSVPTDKGGITCLCACGPVCRRNHQNKQQTGWKIRGTGRPGEFTWTLPSGRSYTTRPASYPI